MSKATENLIAAIENVLEQCEPTPVPYQPLLELQQAVTEIGDTECDDDLERLLIAADDLVNGAYQVCPFPNEPVFINANEYADLVNRFEIYNHKVNIRKTAIGRKCLP